MSKQRTIVTYAEHTNRAGRLVPDYYPGSDWEPEGCPDFRVDTGTVKELKELARTYAKRGAKENSMYLIRLSKSIFRYLDTYYS